VRVGVDSAVVTLRDYTFDREGTRVDIRVEDLETNKEGVREVGSINCKHWGNFIKVQQDGGLFGIGYGVPRVRFGIMLASKHDTATHGCSMFVTYFCVTSEQRLSLVVVQVWYDAAKGSFMCNMTGPSQHSSMVELMVAMKMAFSDVVNSPTASTGQPSTVSSVINNSGGPFYGPLSGSMISDSMFNFINVFWNK